MKINNYQRLSELPCKQDLPVLLFTAYIEMSKIKKIYFNSNNILILIIIIIIIIIIQKQIKFSSLRKSAEFKFEFHVWATTSSSECLLA